MSAADSMVTVLTGPTAGGKSAVALAMARRTGGVIINADASQLYADLAILTARPTPADMADVPHALYGVLDGAQPVSAADWLALATAEIAAAQAQGRRPIVVGGTGMYIATLVHGIAPVPAIDPAIRAEVRALAPEQAAAALAAADPVMAARLKPGDRQRTARALEVVRATGRSLAAWQAERIGGLGPDKVHGLVVDRDRADLNARAAARLRAMVAAGALDEVAALMARGLPDEMPIMKALGVRELNGVLQCTMNMEAALTAATLATCRYQKRQQTWMRHQFPDWSRIPAYDKDENWNAGT